MVADGTRGTEYIGYCVNGSTTILIATNCLCLCVDGNTVSPWREQQHRFMIYGNTEAIETT